MLLLKSNFKNDDRMQQVTREFDHETVSPGFEINAGAKTEVISVKYTLPEAIPISTAVIKDCLVTGLDVLSAVDSKGNDLKLCRLLKNS